MLYWRFPNSTVYQDPLGSMFKYTNLAPTTHLWSQGGTEPYSYNAPRDSQGKSRDWHCRASCSVSTTCWSAGSLLNTVGEVPLLYFLNNWKAILTRLFLSMNFRMNCHAVKRKKKNELFPGLTKNVQFWGDVITMSKHSKVTVYFYALYSFVLYIPKFISSLSFSLQFFIVYLPYCWDVGNLLIFSHLSYEQLTELLPVLIFLVQSPACSRNTVYNHTINLQYLFSSSFSNVCSFSLSSLSVHKNGEDISSAGGNPISFVTWRQMPRAFLQ